MTSTQQGSPYVWLAPLAALVLGFVAAHVHRRVGEPAPPTPDATNANASAADAPSKGHARVDAATAQRSTKTTPRDLPPNPPPDVPLSADFDALAARARAGDVHAALRLLDETSHCALRARETTLLQEAPPNLPDGYVDTSGFYARAQRQREKALVDVAATADLCGDVGSEITATAGEWLERAAAAGDNGAAACYAYSQDLFAPPRFSDGWVDWMRAYRVQAVEYGERSFADGWLQAVGFLYDTYAGPYGGVGYAIDTDATPNYLRAYQLALFESFISAGNASDAGGWYARAKLLEPELSPTQIASARAWATAEVARDADTPHRTLPCHGAEP